MNDENDWFTPRKDRRRDDQEPPSSPEPPARRTPPARPAPPPPQGAPVPPPGHGPPPGPDLPPAEPRRPGQAPPPQRSGRRSRRTPPPGPGTPQPQGDNTPPAQGTPGDNTTQAQRTRPGYDVTRAQGVPPAQGTPPGSDITQAMGLPPRPSPRPRPRAPQGRGSRPTHPDQQVWPPADRTPIDRDPTGGVTQPMPIVRNPLPRPHMPTPQAATQPAAEGQRTPAPEQAPPQERQQPAAGGRRPRKRRTLLVAAAAVVVSLATMGAQSYDGYLFYEKVTTPRETRIVPVAAGQAGKVYNIEYRASIAPMKPPENSKHGSEVTWLKVDITKKVLDPANATMVAEPSESKLTDRAGRTWTVELQPDGDRPTDRLQVGKEYKITGMAIVPTPVANEVELSFRPSTYRSDTPTDDFFDRGKLSKLEQDTDVLSFKRR
ncbi:hypothetical protein ABGB18_43180 [Nonomuraea sp. B12E4]|uniref:hypothetical protein n=1 Tax=Nonomuraea sp. B12E4 TaxID=3153564 RepID=UPI00325E2C70